MEIVLTLNPSTIKRWAFGVLFFLLSFFFSPYFANAYFSPHDQVLSPFLLVMLYFLSVAFLVLALSFFVDFKFLYTKRKELLLFFFALLLCFLFLEVFLRVYYFGAVGLLPSYGDSFSDLYKSDVIQKSNNCGVIYELKPNLDTIFKMVPFKTNSQGLHDKEYSLEKLDDTYRFVVLGDSFTMAQGVVIEDSYHSVLEDSFTAKSSESYEFINFGVSSYFLHQYLTVLKEKAMAYQPDHVLVGFYLENDLPRLDSFEENCFFQVEERTHPYYGSWLVFFLDQKLAILTKKPPLPQTQLHKDLLPLNGTSFFSPPVNRNLTVMFMDNYGGPRFYDLDKLSSITQQFKQVTVDKGISLTFVALRKGTNQFSIEYSLLQAALEKEGISLIDGTRFFPEGASSSDYKVLPLDAHPNAEAHALFAQAIEAHFWKNDTFVP
jgi:hypothetical protein